jgi:hypothetical protein
MPMNVAVQLFAIAITFGLTYIFFGMIGSQRRHLFFSRNEKLSWDANIRGNLGTWLVIASISGTLTSFATYLFFVGTTKVFGWFALATAITVLLSPSLTIPISNAIKRRRRVADLLAGNQQAAAVIANILWTDTANGHTLSRLVKYISITVIGSIVWLEFTAFTDLTLWLNGLSADDGANVGWIRFFLVFTMSFLVIFFVLRFGIRGFVFADLLHAPLIGFTALALAVSALWILSSGVGLRALPTLGAPLMADEFAGIPYGQAILFVGHVLVLNMCQIICSEHHWFRLWLLRDREITRQAFGTTATAILWLIMIPVGFVAFHLSGQPGEAAVAALVTQLGNMSLALVFIFWLGATAALFSTADMQVYAILLVSRFDPRTAQFKDFEIRRWWPFVAALLASLLFASAYVFVRWMGVPLEKLILVIVPSGTVLLPAFVQYARGREPQAWTVAASAIGYWIVAVYGFFTPESSYWATLSAVFIPAIVALLTFRAGPLLQEALEP